MAKTWVLDTETKGTGAQVVPYEKTLRSEKREPDLALVEFDRPPREQPAPEPRQPQRFKVVDVMSAQTLAEDVGAREAVRALEGMRSVLDARISVWSPEQGRWRLLGLEEAKRVWEFRGRLAEEP
ncbi:MAG TPA: hypothetical protein VNV44_10785 [Solirubrobacteraceae bacterium]|jgi:hypothetical protein|nr:hypothetical protein [Solirubrobacteraceae bacterium]